jgi:hypothetical protein
MRIGNSGVEVRGTCSPLSAFLFSWVSSLCVACQDSANDSFDGAQPTAPNATHPADGPTDSASASHPPVQGTNSNGSGILTTGPSAAGSDAQPSSADDTTTRAHLGPGGDTNSPYLPARIRRLTNAEYDATVQTLFTTTLHPSETYSFPPDVRQGPSNSPAGAAFTVNDGQRVDPVLADKLDTAALALVAEARSNGTLTRLAPCSDPNQGEMCADTFVRSFGARAYRRQLTEDEVARLVTAPNSPYHVAADGHAYEDGIDLLARILVQSPPFLYLTELGEARGSGQTLVLSGWEIATAMAYLLTGGPADEPLLSKVAAGELLTEASRAAQAQRLLSTDAGKNRLIRIVREWLGITSVSRMEKAHSVYPDFSNLSTAMEQESHAFIEEVLNSSGTLTELLGADWTVADEALSRVYGIPTRGVAARTSLAPTTRRGILNQGAFLSVFATSSGSHPVFRGVSILRRVLCMETPDPGALGLVVNFPAADPSATTRQRFETHAVDAGCATCHSIIDPLGFAFEDLDGMGRHRTTENGLPIDASVTISLGADFDGSYPNSSELVSAMARSTQVKRCFARQLFRTTAARSDSSVRAAEDAFVEVWEQLDTMARDRLVDVIVAYVQSPLFVERRPL